MTAIQDYLIEQLKQRLGDQLLLAEELTRMLHMSKGNVYRKLRGEIQFTLDETVEIARYFGISLDQCLHNGLNGSGRVVFDYSLVPVQEYTPLLFLKKIMQDLEGVMALPQPTMRYATNEIPIFHSLICRNLLAFKLYVWSRTNWKLPELLSANFCPARMYEQYPEMEMLRARAYELYQRFPSVEYWPRSVLLNILNQIQYYERANLFDDPKMPKTLYQELLVMLESREALAAAGHKGKVQGQENGATFEIYLNEIAFTNNIVLIYKEAQPFAAYATMDNPNFISTSSQTFCQRMHEWVQQIENCSFSTATEQHRLSLFGGMKKQVVKLLENN